MPMVSYQSVFTYRYMVYDTWSKWMIVTRTDRQPCRVIHFPIVTADSFPYVNSYYQVMCDAFLCHLAVIKLLFQILQI